ncbi:MAG TPA: Uma2 family endonuclease [Polyangiaceae bacterium]
MSMLDVTQLAPEQRRPITRAEYQALGDAGFFQDERVELLDGVIVRMSARSARHDSVIERLSELLIPRLVGRARVRIQLGFAASEYSEPEPDVAVVLKSEPREDHPAHATLLVEVSASTLRFDRTAKASIYARAGVPAYFIVNVSARCIEAYMAPEAGRYTETRTYVGDESVAVPGFPDVTFSANDVFAD